MALWKKYWSDSEDDVSATDVRAINEKVGDHVYVDGKEVFQEGFGAAPVEEASPLGYHVGWFGLLFLNVSQMVGTGVFSTPGSILKSLDSVGLSIFFWVFGAIIAAANLAVFLEFAALFPNRSGGQIAYLEQSYTRPPFLFPLAFAFITVALSFSSSNAVVLARYIYRAAGYSASEWANKGLAIAAYSFLALICLISNKWSVRLMNLISAVKLIILLFIVITGFVVLGGGTKVQDPKANFRNSFDDITHNGNAVVNALVKINFAYSGYENAFNVLAEVKKPFKTVRVAAPVSLAIVSVLYILANVAYFAAVPKEVIASSGELTAALFFEAVFGKAGKALPALVAVSAAGNIMAVIIGSTRRIRECARQGLVPWPHIWVSTRPFGTPFAPVLLKWILTLIVIIALPFGDAFNFLVDLRSYPDNIFLFLMVVGLYLVRHKRKKQNIPPAEYRAWDVAAIFSILVALYLLIMPWYPPEGGATGGDVSFWYATYCAVGIGILAGCAAYYFLLIKVIPHFRKYSVRSETIVLEKDGSVTNVLRKIPNTQIAEWDRTHDAAGNLLAEDALGGGTNGASSKFLKRIHVKDSRTLSGEVEIKNQGD